MLVAEVCLHHHVYIESADHIKVGFTGSGKGMTETNKRTRYNHKADAERDEEYAEAVADSRKRY